MGRRAIPPSGPRPHRRRLRWAPNCGVAELGRRRTDFEIRDYPRLPFNGNLEQRIVAHCTPLPAPVPGCLIALKWQRSLAHVALYTDIDTLIHALERHHAVIEHGFRGNVAQSLRAGRVGAAGGAL